MITLRTIPELDVVQTGLVQSFYDNQRASHNPPGGSNLAALFACGQTDALLGVLFVTSIIDLDEFNRVGRELTRHNKAITLRCVSQQ